MKNRITTLINIQLSFILVVLFSTNVILGQDKAAEKNVASPTFIVYYFHNQYRCITCTNMKKWAKEAVETTFKKELAQGIIEFQAINYETKENQHFIDKYMLSNKHVILSRIESGNEKSWKELDKIWKMVRDKTKYQAYIENEINDFLIQKTFQTGKSS